MLEDRTLADLLTAVLDAPDVDALLEGALPVLHGVMALELVEPEEHEAVVRGRAGRPNGVATAQALPGVPERLTVWSTDPDGPGAVPDPVLAVLAMVRRRQRAEQALTEERLRHHDAEEALRHSVEEVVALDVRLQEVRLRRRHALELNDHIVQALAACVLAMEDGREAAAGIYIQRTLDTAKRMMADMLAGADEMDDHHLLRDTPLVIDPDLTLQRPPPAPLDPDVDHVTVLLVDDSDEIRFLLRANLESDGRFVVVGEAANGREAIDAAGVLQPDAVILDASMPVMTGIDALPHLREVAPDAALIVLSAYSEGRLAELAAEAGAVAYLEKGTAMADLVRVVLEHTGPPGPA